MPTSNPILAFAIAVLAVWRISHLIAHEEGPFRLFGRWRALVGRRAAGKVFTCFQCLSLWVGAALAVWLSPSWTEAVLLAIALSGAACLLNRIGAEPLVVHPLRIGERQDQGDSHDDVLRKPTVRGWDGYDPLFELEELRRRAH